MVSFLPPPLTVDNVTLQQSAAGVISLKDASVTAAKLAAGVGVSVILVPGSATGVGATPQFYGGTVNATESKAVFVAPFACTVVRVDYRTGSGATTTGTIVLRKNGADTTNTVSVAGGSADGTQTDSGHTVTLAAGDTIAISVTRTGGGNTVFLYAASIEVLPL